jgi:hypothetical protein
VTPDARILRFAARGRHAGGPPAEYGRFPDELSLDEFASCFFFDDEDRRLIARRRTDMTRMGFAVQSGTLRYLGRFLEDPAEVPAGVVQWIAREIGVPAGTDLTAYGRGDWRWAHQDEIRREYGYRPFGHAGVEDELVGWLRARAWVSAESHPVLFARAVEHLIGAKVLLPGASTLWRLVGAAREHANERGWTLVGGALTDEQRGRLEGLLAVASGRRESELERLRQVPVEPTVAGLIATLERLRELRVVADGLSELESLPVARVRALTVTQRLAARVIWPRCPTPGGWRPWSRSPRSPPSAVRTTRSSTSIACRASCSCGCASRASANACATTKRSTGPG